MASLLGRTLGPAPLPAQVREDREEKPRAAQAALEAAPDDAGAAIWLGRRLAYLGRYREAVEVFGRGLDAHPGDARLLSTGDTASSPCVGSKPQRPIWSGALRSRRVRGQVCGHQPASATIGSRWA